MSFVSEVIKNMGLRKKNDLFTQQPKSPYQLGGTYWNGQKQVEWKGM